MAQVVCVTSILEVHGVWIAVGGVVVLGERGKKIFCEVFSNFIFPENHFLKNTLSFYAVQLHHWLLSYNAYLHDLTVKLNNFVNVVIITSVLPQSLL